MKNQKSCKTRLKCVAHNMQNNMNKLKTIKINIFVLKNIENIENSNYGHRQRKKNWFLI